MSNVYRDEHEAALRQLEALRRENEALRERLADLQRETGGASLERESSTQPSAVLALIAGLFFLAGSVTVAGTARGRCASRDRVHPCPFMVAHGEGALERGARLLRNEPGMIRVELTQGNETAQVLVDGMVIPRSGATALSGPLAGGAMHVVDVSDGGFIQSRTRVWVEPGRTEVVRVSLAPAPHRKQVDEEKVDEDGPR